MSSAYFWPLVLLPTVIDRPGAYLTRSGETVQVATVSHGQNFRCRGEYACGISEGWHRSGRIFAGVISQNDIVAGADR